MRNASIFSRFLAQLKPGWAVVCLMGMIATPAQAVLLTLEADSPFVGNGDPVAIELIVGDLGSFSAPSVGAFDVTVSFDPSVLAFQSYTLGGLLGDPDSFEALDVSSGLGGASINVAEVSLLSIPDLHALQPSEFVLATLAFDVIQLSPGDTTQLSILPDPTLGDSMGRTLIPTGGAPITIVGSVPSPATLSLILAGLLGIRWARCRRAR